MGERRVRRLQRSRRLRLYSLVGLGVVGVLVYSAFATATLVKLQDRNAGAETRAGAPAVAQRVRAERLAARLMTNTFTKPVPTKRPRSVFPDAPANSGEGRRIVYCNSCQRVWLVEDDDWVYWSYLVSGRRNFPKPGTYKVFRKINPGTSHDLRLPYFVGFTYGTTTDVGFHGIPVQRNGRQIQSDSQLGTPRSAGCVRQSQPAARLLWDWTPMGTKVVVLP